MVRNIHGSTSPFWLSTSPRGDCTRHAVSAALTSATYFEETAAHLNKTSPAIEDPINITVTPYDIRGLHYPDFHHLRRYQGQDQTPVSNPIDAILTTGGSPGVYEMDHSPWMQFLEKFIKTIYTD